jgi:N-acetylmuramoyl-L-alanine amidase
MLITPLKRLAKLALCLAALLAPGGIAAAAGPNRPETVAIGVHVETDGGKTLFKITLSQAVAATAQVMERPDRVILDLPEVAFHQPSETGRSRVVMDLVQPALVSRIDTLPHPRDGSTLLIVELAKAERDEFHRAAIESASSLAAPVVEAAADNPKDRRPVIMLDPGHGGVDPGAAAAGRMFEKDIVFAFAQMLKKKLEGEGRYRVLMTREQDVFIPLGERVRLAQRAKADLFISIHADSIAGGQQDVRGFTVYTGSERASDADSARLADRENQADSVAGVESGENAAEDVSDILRDLTTRETRAFSHNFATRLVGELDTVARMNKNPYRQAGFRVLRANDTPSVLVELGYLSSRKDFDLLTSDEWRDRSTAAMTAAIDRFFATRLARQGAAPVSP